MSQSVSRFPTPTRIHVALATSDLTASQTFYEVLFGESPTKQKPDYVKFEPLDPPVNLTLNLVKTVMVPPAPEHFGIQLQSIDTLSDRKEIMQNAGYPGHVENAVDCCYARQDKVWFKDPEGRSWELFVVLDVQTETTVTPSCCP